MKTPRIAQAPKKQDASLPRPAGSPPQGTPRLTERNPPPPPLGARATARGASRGGLNGQRTASWPAVGVGTLVGVAPPPVHGLGSPLVVPPRLQRRRAHGAPRAQRLLELRLGARLLLLLLPEQELVELRVGALDAVLPHAPELGLLAAQRPQVLARALDLAVVDVPPDAARARVHCPVLEQLVPW